MDTVISIAGKHDEMDQPGFLEETASEYGCTSKEELEKKKRHGKG
nr:YrzK family protein [Bacillus pumilus]